MITYTCSCCRHIEYRFGVGCNAYYCTVRCEYMYPGSLQCKEFELKAQTNAEGNQDEKDKED